MSLEIVNSVQARCTMLKEFAYRLAWRPERDYAPGTQVELRSHCLRAFHAWKLRQVEAEGADLVYRWKRRPSVSDIFANSERVLVRVNLELDLDLSIPLGKVGQSGYFYLRAIERSGGLIYASPVFVTISEE